MHLPLKEMKVEALMNYTDTLKWKNLNLFKINFITHTHRLPNMRMP